MNPELSSPEKFVGSLYPRKLESDKTSLGHSWRKRNLINLLPRMVFKCIAINFNCQNRSKNHKIRLVE